MLRWGQEQAASARGVDRLDLPALYWEAQVIEKTHWTLDYIRSLDVWDLRRLREIWRAMDAAEAEQ